MLNITHEQTEAEITYYATKEYAKAALFLVNQLDPKPCYATIEYEAESNDEGGSDYQARGLSFYDEAGDELYTYDDEEDAETNGKNRLGKDVDIVKELFENDLHTFDYNWTNFTDYEKVTFLVRSEGYEERLYISDLEEAAQQSEPMFTVSYKSFDASVDLEHEWTIAHTKEVNIIEASAVGWYDIVVAGSDYVLWKFYHRSKAQTFCDNLGLVIV
jgi:hypothetical protein